MHKIKKPHYAWIMVLLLSLLMVSIDTQTLTIGVFMPEVASSLNIGMGVASIAYSAMYYVSVVLAPILSRVHAKYPTKWIVIAILLVQIASLVIMSSAKSVAAFLIGCTLAGFALTDFLLLMGHIVAKRWFETDAQFVFDISLFISMASGAALTQVARALIDLVGWRQSYLCFAGFVVVIVLPVILLFMKESPEQMGIEPYYRAKSRKVQRVALDVNAGVTAKSAWRSKAFYLLVAFSTAIVYPDAIQNHFVAHLEVNGFSSSLSALVLSGVMLGGLVGRLIISFSNEKIGIKASTFIYCVLGITAIILFANAGRFSEEVVIALGFLWGFAIKVAAIQVAQIEYKVFGASSDYVSIVANINVLNYILVATSGILYGFIYDFTGSYTIGFIIIVVMLAIAAIMPFFLLNSRAVEAKKMAVTE